MDISTRTESGSHKAGGAAALYLAAAYIIAMPYFLLLVDYPGATTAADKVALLLGNHSSLLAMYLATYVVFGIVLGVLALALYDRLRAAAPFAARVATAVGLLWAFALVASGMIFNYGMTTVVSIAKTDGARAEMTWQAIEPIAQALGGAGGELLGGLWVLLVSWIALRGHALPKALNWLGIVTGLIGLASVVPQLQPTAYAFGLLQILWFAWLGVAMVRAGGATARAEQTTVGRAVRAPGL
jgi:hypothetical protein